LLTVETRYAVDPNATRAMDTATLRQNFHIGGMFAEGEIRLTYSHYDRMIVGGVVPGADALVLDHVAQCGTASILDRREMGVLNIGGAATVSAAGTDHAVGRGDMLYLQRGSGPITFHGPGKFYIVSTPAHAIYPTRLVTLDDAATLTLGASETANARTIHQFIHPDVMETCQLVMGYTMFQQGSVWNTMPAHVHDRRMEAYLYFDMDQANRVFHFMGEPQETRHIVMQSDEAVLSPPWSIHCGAGTGRYTFCWAMAGDNVDYTDVDMVAMDQLR
jgi:4-deoxy-L-threo-5-hexosulose-uronate ketol-isomerase